MSEWIRIQEKLPKHNQPVDLWLDRKGEAKPHRISRTWHKEDTAATQIFGCKITHWKPAPLPPNDRNDERSVATVDAQSGEAGQQKETVLKEGDFITGDFPYQTKTWQTDFTYFLEHLISHDKEKIKLIVAEVERIAGSKKEE